MKRMSCLGALVFLIAAQPARANIDIQFDYSYADDYFSGANTGLQTVLDDAAAVFETRLTDTLGAIDSTGSSNHFDILFSNPGDPTRTTPEFLANQSFDTDVLRVYVGGYRAPDHTLGYGGPGGYECQGMTCAEASRSQGQTTGSNATDFGPWGGSISFNFSSTINWNFSATSAPGASQYDFYSVALHELGHVLGFGTADSFDALVSGGQFSGGTAGTVNLSSDGAHWADGTMSVTDGISQEAAMTPSLPAGERKYFTDLDFAALRDIGWQVSAVPEPDDWAMLVAGLALIVPLARRRRR
jgi:MYXO-CTERM domain-containing protein